MSEDDINQAAFRKLKPAIDKKYDSGRFIAIAGGQVIADAETFDALTERLEAIGKDSAETLVVQAGVDYPDKVTIFL